MLLAVFALGFAAGLRTLLAPAALLLVRGGVAGYVLAVGSLAELGLDLSPVAQSRTRAVALAGRLVSGAVTGWLFLTFVRTGITWHSSSDNGTTQVASISFLVLPPVVGALVAMAGALAGAFGGKAFRLWLIGRIGAVPAALVEDAIAVAIVWIVLALAGPR
jgi:uncharacterized membrane protein